MKQVVGYYNERKYQIDVDGTEVYQAGNSPYESQDYLNADEGVGLEKMRTYCISTAKEIARENNAQYIGVQYLED